MKSKNMSLGNSFAEATGPLEYRLTNDYLFRAVLQKSNKTLKGLICSVLHKKPEEIFSVTILNPIALGEAIDDKTFILDVKVLLNNREVINLEMQITDYANWTDRSISYLCRSFDTLEKGQDYLETRPVIHICFLDFNLFPESPEFCAKYMLMNVKNHTIYSDKLQVYVVELGQTKLATEEDCLYGTDRWAALFKSETWEELKMLAEKNEFLSEASETIYQLNADDKIREQCWAREEYDRIQRTVKRQFEIINGEKAALEKKLEEQNEQLAQQLQEKATQDALIASLKARLAQYE